MHFLYLSLGSEAKSSFRELTMCLLATPTHNRQRFCLDGRRQVEASTAASDIRGFISPFFVVKGTAALRLIVQPCDEDD
jgi:hypothetical protein